MSYHQCGELFVLREEENIADNHQPLCLRLAQRHKDRVEFFFSADIQDVKLHAGRAGGCLRLFNRVSAAGLVGLTSRAMILAVGTASRNSSKSLGPTSALKLVTPVTLPPGRFRLATRPIWTGSLKKQ